MSNLSTQFVDWEFGIPYLPSSFWLTPEGRGPWVKCSTGCGEGFSALAAPWSHPPHPHPDLYCSWPVCFLKGDFGKEPGECHWTCWPDSSAPPPSSFPPAQNSQSPPGDLVPSALNTTSLLLLQQGRPLSRTTVIKSSSSQSNWLGVGVQRTQEKRTLSQKMTRTQMSWKRSWSLESGTPG